MSLYIIASYDHLNEIDFVPVKWLVGNVDIASAIANGTNVEHYWPPFRNQTKLSKAKSKCIDAEIGWRKDTCRILGRAG